MSYPSDMRLITIADYNKIQNENKTISDDLIDVFITYVEKNSTHLSYIGKNIESAMNLIETIKEEGKNGGSTFRNFGLKEFLIIIYEAENEANLKNVKAHELRHLTDRMLEWANIDDSEAAAFLQGYLFEKLY